MYKRLSISFAMINNLVTLVESTSILNRAKMEKCRSSNKITSFRNEYFFLSNFYPIEIYFEGKKYPTAEHAFQAAKCLNIVDRDKVCRSQTPAIAKSIGRSVQLRNDWDFKKLEIMEQILKIKFTNVKMKFLLQSTKNCEIIEQNRWHDQYWGVCVCQKHKLNGQNHLGKIIMKIRSELSV